MRLIRYVDASVVGCEKRQEAEQFQEALRQRFAKCGLELHPEKTRLIEFGRFAQERRASAAWATLKASTFWVSRPGAGSPEKGRFQI